MQSWQQILLLLFGSLYSNLLLVLHEVAVIGWLTVFVRPYTLRVSRYEWQETWATDVVCARKKRVSTPKAQIWKMIHNYCRTCHLEMCAVRDPVILPTFFWNDKHYMQATGLYFFMVRLGFNCLTTSILIFVLVANKNDKWDRKRARGTERKKEKRWQQEIREMLTNDEEWDKIQWKLSAVFRWQLFVCPCHTHIS